VNFQTLNPATEELIHSYPELNWKEVEGEALALRKRYTTWKKMPLEGRVELFKGLSKLLKAKKAELALIPTEEMGKPIAQSEAMIEKCAWLIDYYAGNAAEFLADEEITTDAGKSYVRREPIGTIFTIMPWNFPFWQVFRCAVPAMMAGNVVLLKHAPNVPRCAMAIENLFEEAGFDKAFRSLFFSNETAAKLIESDLIEGVSLTGSDRAGSQVAAAAGKSLKKVVLELGGSDPFLVFADCDLEKVIPAVVQSRLNNAGQVCISGKRYFVEESISKEFETKLVDAFRSQKLGDPKDRSVTMGPLARKDLLDNITRQVDESVKQGAELLCGGERWGSEGFFYLPTILKNVKPGMTCFEEETFGPVASLTSFSNEEEAIELANQSRYGLAASVWTKDKDRMQRMISGLDVGSVFVNGVVHSDPRLPFGGTKGSGFGRELGREGILEFTNLKTVWIK
jgi:succinate-semialdehyde dehydrogenase / glutarate-semialdehyde dehydrogenase